MKYLILSLVAILSLGLSGCGDDPQQYYPPVQQQQYAQPQQYAPQYAQPQYQQQHDDGIGMGSVLAAGIGGAVLGNMMSGSGDSTSRTVNNTTTNTVQKSGYPVKNTVTPLKKRVDSTASRTVVKKPVYKPKATTSLSKPFYKKTTSYKPKRTSYRKKR